MIKIVKIIDDGIFVGIEASGHAGQAPKGESVVCAAVSTLMEFSEFCIGRLPLNIKLKDVYKRDGYHRIIVRPSAIASNTAVQMAKFVLDSLDLSLIGLANQYPNFIEYKDPLKEEK